MPEISVKIEKAPMGQNHFVEKGLAVRFAV